MLFFHAMHFCHDLLTQQCDITMILNRFLLG